MTDDEVQNGWWAKQSSGAKLAIAVVCICCVGLIAIVGLAGMIAPDATTSSSTYSSTDSSQEPASPGDSGVKTTDAKESYIEVSYAEGYWDGSITVQSGSNEEELNFDGSGTKKFDLSKYKDSDVYIMAQKQDGGTGKLSAKIVRDGKTKLTKSTTEGYGIVSGWVFSWE